MILLTKLDGAKLLLPMENVKYIECTPDSLIFFTNGDSAFVRESLDEITSRVVEYKSKILNSSQQ